MLTRELGIEWMPVRNGPAEIAGVPGACCGRSAAGGLEIEAKHEQRGASGAAAAQAAAAEGSFICQRDELGPELERRSGILMPQLLRGGWTASSEMRSPSQRCAASTR